MFFSDNAQTIREAYFERKVMEMRFQPIIPFEPASTERIPPGENWVAQIKWDGVRILTYYDGNEIRLFNRKTNERTWHYPELHEIHAFCAAGSIILDGEIIALGKNGKPSFHEVMRRDGIRRMERVDAVKNSVPISYMIFDVLFLNGQWVNHKNLQERIELLANIVIPGEHVQLVTSHHDGETLFNVIQQQQMEGIVIKDLNSKYYINGKNDRWLKMKNYRDLVAVIGGVTIRDGIVNAVLLGLYDQSGQLWYIGHAGTGRLTKQEWRDLTERIKPLITKERTFANKPERIKDAIWIQPLFTAKIQYIDWTADHLLRQPSIQAFVNVPPEECRYETSL